jgi:hypothetical protein
VPRLVALVIFVNVGLPVALVAVVVWGIPSAWGTHLQRSLIAVFVSLAVAFLLGQDLLGSAVDWITGVPSLGVMLVQHLAVLATLSFYVDFVKALLYGEDRAFRARHLLTIALGLTMTLMFAAVVPHSDRDLTYDNIPGRGWVLLYRSLNYTAMFAAAAVLGQLMARTALEARRAGRSSAGYVLMASGCVSGAAFGLWRLGTMYLLYLTHRSTIGWCEDIALGLMCVSTLLVVAGGLVPALAAGWQAVRAAMALHRLRPLWTDLTQAVPEVVLECPPVGLWPELRARRLGLQLWSRSVEIRDATRQLAYYAPSDLWPRARAAVERVDVPADTAASQAEAVWLHAALALVRGGAVRRESAGAVAPAHTCDVTHVLQVAAAYRRPADQLAD